MGTTEAVLASPLNGSEPNTASVLKGWRTFHHHAGFDTRANAEFSCTAETNSLLWIRVKRGGQICGRAEVADKVNRKLIPKHRLAIRVTIFLIASSIVGGVISQTVSDQPASAPRNAIVDKTASPTSKAPQSLAGLLDLSPAELEHCDIARMNLLCAEGLPGAENLNVDECLATLDEWAQHIKGETDRNYHHFKEDPAYYSNSEAFYKILMMAVVLYEDYGVRYNPKLITSLEATKADDHFFADSRDILIHGLLEPQHLGTCSSMPILYVALGRRLDYPLKLVKAKGHLFMRWDSPSEKFDLDATGKGVDKLDDEFYKKWPFPLTEADIQAEDYLKSLSAKQELSVFLSIRGECQTDNEQLGDALASFSLAYKFAPTWKGNQVMFERARARLARPIMLVQQQQPINPNIPADPAPTQPIQPRNPFQTP